MRAAVISGPGHVEVANVDDPSPGRGEVVVAVAACGLCGTDLHLLHGQLATTFPLVPGHEFAGEVVAVGRDVTTLRTGDRVAVDPNLPCHDCHECRRGRANLCERYAALGVTTAGGAAEFAVAPASTCVVVPDHVDLQDAALVEPMSCAVRGFDVLQGRLGDRVLVYGAGTMGLLNTALALRAGASSVDVVDLNVDRLPVAQAVGAARAVIDADLLDNERGWDVVIDCTGVVAAIEDGLARVARGGTFLQFGVTRPDATASWSPYRVYRNEISILGSMAVLNSFDRAASLLAAGVIDPDVIIGARFPLEQYPDAMAAFEGGAGPKVQVVSATSPTGPVRDR